MPLDTTEAEFLAGIESRDGVDIREMATVIISCGKSFGYETVYERTEDGKLSCKLSWGRHQRFFDLHSNAPQYNNIGLWFTINGSERYKKYSNAPCVGEVLAVLMEEHDERPSPPKWKSAKIDKPIAVHRTLFVLGAFATHLNSFAAT